MALKSLHNNLFTAIFNCGNTLSSKFDARECGETLMCYGLRK